MGSSCSSGSKKEKSKKKTKKNGAQHEQAEEAHEEKGQKNDGQEHRGSNASNSSVYVYHKSAGDNGQGGTAVEAAQVVPPSAGTAYVVSSPYVAKARVERVDSTSISSPLSPAQFAQQRDGHQDQAPTGRNADLNLLADHVRELVTGQLVDARSTLEQADRERCASRRSLLIILCLEGRRPEIQDAAMFDELVQSVRAAAESRSRSYKSVQVEQLHSKLDPRAWQEAFDGQRDTLVVVVLLMVADDGGDRDPDPGSTALPNNLPTPSSKEDLSKCFLHFYENDCNSIAPSSSYTLRPASGATLDSFELEELQQLWTDLLRVYPLDCLFGWNWALNRICGDDRLMRNCICVCSQNSQSVDKLRACKLNDKCILKVPPNQELWSSSVQERLAPLINGFVAADAMLDSSQPTIPTNPLLSISKHLYEEMVAQQRVAQVLTADLTDVNAGAQEPSALFSSIKSYLLAKSCHPLILYGAPGCGRTTTMALASQLCSQWSPDAHIVLRFCNFTPESRDLNRLLGSVVQQISFLLGECRSSSLKAFDLPNLLQQLSPFHPLIIMLDGLDSVQVHHQSSPPTTATTSPSCPPSPRESFDWVPTFLPDNVWLVLTAAEPSPFLTHLKSTLPATHCVCIDPLPENVGFQMLCAQMQMKRRTLTKKQFEVVEKNLKRGVTTPLLIQLVSHCAVFWTSSHPPPQSLPVSTSIVTQADALLQTFEEQASVAFGGGGGGGGLPATATSVELTSHALAYLLLSKHGLTRTELTDLLRIRFSDDRSSRCGAPRMYRLIRDVFEPHFFMENRIGDDTVLSCISAPIRSAAIDRYHLSDGDGSHYREHLREYFDSTKSPPPTRRKLEELTPLCGFSAERFIYDWQWMWTKICTSSVEEVLEDVDGLCRSSLSPDDNRLELQMLADVLRDSIPALSYDGNQFFSQMHARLLIGDQSHYSHLNKLVDTAVRCPPVPCLLSPQNGFLFKSPSSNSAAAAATPSARTGDSFTIYRIKDSPSHFALLNPSKNEIAVWNIFTQKIVRRIGGVPQPRDIKFIDAHRAVILCNRELCIYDLNRAKLVMKLKGVMNQKMAYYDLHGDDHVVALSRNRMYVNMMNLSNGDCVATFKVGEDRFLNSLLVSANGGVCVCGDETQKPFPLLVWDLDSRKLLYDLRIPNHDFVTSLSAITSDGHYVVCVCQEVGDPTPNFIIVYDLQNGTLFKKWKPEVSTCSVAISSDGGCVVTGLVNSNVIVWDLFTGTCRHCLRGHTAPVTFVSLDKWGRRCLTADLPKGRDLAVRLWDLSKGTCLASLMVDEKPVACELTEDGGAVVLGLSGARSIVCLLLITENMTLEKAIPPSGFYGDEECDNLQVDLTG